MKKLLVPITFLISISLFLNGCLSLRLGGGKKTEQNRSENYENVTLGQQLIDLKKIYDEGVISKWEYDRQRKKLLKGK